MSLIVPICEKNVLFRIKKTKVWCAHTVDSSASGTGKIGLWEGHFLQNRGWAETGAMTAGIGSNLKVPQMEMCVMLPVTVVLEKHT